MTFSELKTYTATTMMRRPDLLADIGTALEQAHLDLQSTVIRGQDGVQYSMEWPCMQYRMPVADAVTFEAGSIYMDLTEFDANCKRLTEVWTANDDGAETPILPASDEEIKMYGRFERTEFANATIPSGVYHQRWYMVGTQFKLLFPPATGGSDVDLTAEMFRRLPAYEEDGDQDFFSIVCPTVLADLAAAYAWEWIGEDDEALKVKLRGEARAIQKFKSVKSDSKGAADRVRRPPTAQSRRF